MGAIVFSGDIVRVDDATAAAAESARDAAATSATAAAAAAAEATAAAVSAVRPATIFVSADGDDEAADEAESQPGPSGQWVYPLAWSTIAGATAKSRPGDTIIVGPGHWTEDTTILPGRQYEFQPGALLVDATLTGSGIDGGGVIAISGLSMRRTAKATQMLIVDDAEYRIDLDQVDDQNLAATEPMMAFRRSWTSGSTAREMVTAWHNIAQFDALWDALAMARPCIWTIGRAESTYPSFSAGTTSRVLFRIDRGQQASIRARRLKSAANHLIGIGALSDPSAATQTRLRLDVELAETTVAPLVYYGRGGVDTHHVEIGAGSRLKGSSGALTARLNTAGGMTLGVAGSAVANALPHSEVALTYGALIVSGAA